MRLFLSLLILATSAAAADWPVYKAPDGKFTIALPGKVTVKQGQNRYSFGLVTITAHTHKADKDTVWRVATHDYPAAFVKQITPAKLMNAMATGMPKNVKGKLIGPKPVKHAGHEGVAFQVADAAPNGYDIHVRLFTVDSRVYQLTLVGNPNSPAFKQVDKFFESFKPAK
ncbi:MAG: hypothetical protein H8E27_05490 [Verrucomicrobia subdivision 3 bacterium]|nr:hypothetical protein [Limisphaerales bacterium]